MKEARRSAQTELRAVNVGPRVSFIVRLHHGDRPTMRSQIRANSLDHRSHPLAGFRLKMRVQPVPLNDPLRNPGVRPLGIDVWARANQKPEPLALDLLQKCAQVPLRMGFAQEVEPAKSNLVEVPA